MKHPLDTRVQTVVSKTFHGQPSTTIPANTQGIIKAIDTLANRYEVALDGFAGLWSYKEDEVQALSPMLAAARALRRAAIALERTT